MAVRGGDLRAVGPAVDLWQRLPKAPHARADKVDKGAGTESAQGQPIFHGLLALGNVPERINQHQQDRQRLQGAEDTAPPEPIMRRKEPKQGSKLHSDSPRR